MIKILNNCRGGVSLLASPPAVTVQRDGKPVPCKWVSLKIDIIITSNVRYFNMQSEQSYVGLFV